MLEHKNLESIQRWNHSSILTHSSLSLSSLSLPQITVLYSRTRHWRAENLETDKSLLNKINIISSRPASCNYGWLSQNLLVTCLTTCSAASLTQRLEPKQYTSMLWTICLCLNTSLFIVFFFSLSHFHWGLLVVYNSFECNVLVCRCFIHYLCLYLFLFVVVVFSLLNFTYGSKIAHSVPSLIF